jgi:hypothetical protein
MSRPAEEGLSKFSDLKDVAILLSPSSITAPSALYTTRSVFPGIYVVESVAFGWMSTVAPYWRPFATLAFTLTLRATQDVRVRNP